MYQSWYRLETRTTSAQMKELPFDLMYLVPEKELKTFGQVYDSFLTVKLTDKIKEIIENKHLDKISKIGITRKHTSQTSLLSKAKVADHLPKKYLEDTILCIPTLPKKRGGKLSIAYMVSREALQVIEANHSNLKKYSWAKGACQQELLGEMELHHAGGVTLPCAICANGIRKAMDSSFCTLGTGSCLEKINLKNVESFEEKITKAVDLPEVIQ